MSTRPPQLSKLPPNGGREREQSSFAVGAVIGPLTLGAVVLGFMGVNSLVRGEISQGSTEIGFGIFMLAFSAGMYFIHSNGNKYGRLHDEAETEEHVLREIVKDRGDRRGF